MMESLTWQAVIPALRLEVSSKCIHSLFVPGEHHLLSPELCRGFHTSVVPLQLLAAILGAPAVTPQVRTTEFSSHLLAFLSVNTAPCRIETSLNCGLYH